MPPFKLVATDLDGTLFGPDLEIGARVQAAFGRARRAGADLVIATGRMFCSALPYARILDVTHPLITYQGAWIRDPNSLESIWHRRLPAAAALAAIRAVRSAGIHLNLYREDVLYVERVTPECEWYCAQARIAPSLADDLEAMHDGVTKLVAIAQPEVLDRHEMKLKHALQGDVYVVRSTPRYLEFAAAGTSKAIALRELAARLGVAEGAILAFGDADNDADMLEMAGMGVSVGAASPAARQAADRHAEAVGQGVADVLEEVFA